MKNLSKEKRDQLILISIGTVAILAGLWFGVGKFQGSKIAAKQQQLTDLETELANAERIIGEREKIQRELDADRAVLAEIEDGMVRGDMYAWMIQTINDFKTTYKVTIPQISRETLGATPYREGFPYESAVFKIQGSAHYHDLGKFIADFENKFPFMKLQNLRLTTSSQGPRDGEQPEELNFSMEIVSLIKPATT